MALRRCRTPSQAGQARDCAALPAAVATAVVCRMSLSPRAALLPRRAALCVGPCLNVPQMPEVELMMACATATRVRVCRFAASLLGCRLCSRLPPPSCTPPSTHFLSPDSPFGRHARAAASRHADSGSTQRAGKGEGDFQLPTNASIWRCKHPSSSFSASHGPLFLTAPLPLDIRGVECRACVKSKEQIAISTPGLYGEETRSRQLHAPPSVLAQRSPSSGSAAAAAAAACAALPTARGGVRRRGLHPLPQMLQQRIVGVRTTLVRPLTHAHR